MVKNSKNYRPPHFLGVVFGLFLVIKLHRKVIETWFWYQKIDLSEYNQNKLLWGQLNNYKCPERPKNLIFGHFWPLRDPFLTTKFATNNEISVRKMFFHTLVCPYQHFSMIERRYSPPEKTSVKTNCPLNCTHNPTIDVQYDIINRIRRSLKA